MKSLDELKAEIKEEASKNPEKFFPTEVLKEKGFTRGECKNCGINFWSLNEQREICGEPECGDGYTFINNSPTKKEFTHIESWKAFNEFMQTQGYTSIDRYPVIARWRDDVEFTGASIYCFQPYVVSGEAEPPASELVIPQPSLRFNDVDNVGITGRHYTNFTMIGQTCFQPPEKYDINRYFRDMFNFTAETLGIPEEKMIIHEESWGGGGNLGPSMECFIDGLELWNQVYMLYKQTPDGYEELDLQVLDMGMGHERLTWISNGTETSYESVMPKTLEKMKKRTGLEVDQRIWEKFLPHSSELNIDEVEDIDKKWREIAEEIDEDVDELKSAIKPAAALYSVAEHARALIFALADGKIPSNTGGGHNLRMIYRRAKDFIEKYDWDLDMKEVAQWNAEELKPMFPELLDSIDEIEEILEVEAEKYEKARQKAENKLSKLDKQPSVEEMLELYESHGVSPEMMEEHGFSVPEDFYTMLGEEEETLTAVEEDFNLETVPDTEKLYYKRREPYREDGKVKNFSFEASLEAIVDEEWIVLDKTMFYPQGGGQMHDVGTINGFKVVDVQKQGNVVLHQVPDHELTEGDSVTGEVDGKRRKQLTQHHSVTHIVNAVAREELGEHIYQAGANKTLEKARLDITHYEKPSKEALKKIERRVREVIKDNHKINVLELPKSEAEQEYGFRIYQGGAPPGNTIRLIDIEDIDIEACGGTHLTFTSHAEEFSLTNCNRIQDGVIRLEYKAGEAAREFNENIESLFEEVASLLFEENETVLGKTSNRKDYLAEIKPVENLKQEEKREILEKLAEKYSVEKKELPKTIDKFLNERENAITRADKIEAKTGISPSREFSRQGVFSRARELFEQNKIYEAILETGDSLFEDKKEKKKYLDNLESNIEDYVEDKIQDKATIELEIPTENVGLLIQVAQKLSRKHDACITLIGDKGAVSASQNNESAEEKLEKYSNNVQGDESFAKAFDI